MKPATLLLVPVALAFVATAAGCAWLMSTYAPGHGPMALYLGASIIPQMMMILIALLMPATLVIGLIGLAGRGPGKAPRVLLIVIAAMSTVLGALGALYGGMMIQQAIRAVGPVSLAVTAPSWAEVLLTLAWGLFGALVALGFHARLARRG